MTRTPERQDGGSMVADLHNGATEDALADLDAEHRYVFDLLHRFRNTTASSITPRQLTSFITSLVRHMERHWTHEEDLMRSTGFPQCDEHVAAHKEGLAILDRLLSPDRTHAEAMEAIEGFLPAWLNNHIMKSDADFFTWLKENRPKIPDSTA